MKKGFTFLGSVAALALVSIGGSYFYLQNKSCNAASVNAQVLDSSQPIAVPAAQQARVNSGIQWISFEEAQKRNKTKPKKLFVDLYTDWCGWCKVLDKRTYTQQYLVDYLNENFYNVKFNAEQRESVVFSGREYKFIPKNRSGYHELAAALTEGNLSYPTLIFINEKFQPITYVGGFQEAPELMDMLVFINEDRHLKGESFEDFKKGRAASRKQVEKP